ncbi:unnamed protein product [Ostreobium quekettii]|uniref:Protein kinase domain-containing protein n=1 Tax=Ostreobium quekettii TaxID=121088 RepID=A0A8S1IN88_9CHLO|nr:unnamed protein product [Ostreobium quekettii]
MPTRAGGHSCLWLAVWAVLWAGSDEIEVDGTLARAEALGATKFAGETDGTAFVETVREVGTSLELWKAFRDGGVETILVTKDLFLRRNVWPGDDHHRRHAVRLRRNVTLEAHPSWSGRLPRVDVDFMRFRVTPDKGYVLKVRRLQFIHAVKNAKDKELLLSVPFFSQLKESTLVLEGVVSDVAVGHSSPLGDVLELEGKVRPAGLQEVGNRLRLVGDEHCRVEWGVACPGGALSVENFASVVQINMQWEGTIKSYDATLVVRNSLMVGINVDDRKFFSTEDISKKRTFVADNLFELFKAMMDPEVVMVYLFNDMVFDMSSWPNHHGHLIRTCSLDRDIVITTHPTSSGLAEFDFNLAESGIAVTRNATLVLKDVLLTRTSRNPNHTLTLPFFDLEQGTRLLLDGVVAHTPIPTTDQQYILSFVDTLKDRSAGSPSHSIKYHDDSQCREIVQGLGSRNVTCDGGFWVTSMLGSSSDVGLRIPPEDLAADMPGLVVVNNSFFSVLDLQKREIKSAEERLRQEKGIAIVSKEGELRKALKDATVKTVWLRNNMNLTRKAWGSSQNGGLMIVDRDVRIQSHPNTAYALAIDLNFMVGRVSAGEGQRLELVRLNLTRVSREGRHLHFVPFFSWQHNSTLNFKQVLSQMAIEPSKFGPLNHKYARMFAASDGLNKTVPEVINDAMCKKMASTDCQDRALYIVEVLQQISVCRQSLPMLQDFTQQPCPSEGVGIFEAKYMLILARNVERCPLYTREEVEAGQMCMHQPIPGDFNNAEETSEDGNALKGIGWNWTLFVYFVVVIVIAFPSIYVFRIVARFCNSPSPVASQVKSSQVQDYGAEELPQANDEKDECVLQEHQEAAAELLGDLTLGPLMGIGSYARVYRAFWKGMPVAVKVILHEAGGVEAKIEREAVLSTKLQHPNIVQGYHFTTRAASGCCRQSEIAIGSAFINPLYVKGGEPTSRSMTSVVESGSPQTSVVTSSVLFSDQAATREAPGLAPQLYRETWLVQELCDRGTLMEGLSSGLFRKFRESAGAVYLEHVILACLDIARAMEYLHSNHIVHGDLKSGNVLLQSSASDPRGYVVKVADFGLSRQMVADKAHLTTSFYGTVTHMPPEVLMQGHLSLATDIYSFGMIMWEIMAGEPPFRNLVQMEVMRKVVLERQRPEFPSWTPSEYRRLTERCWCDDHNKRIPFTNICECLSAMLPSKALAPSLERWLSTSGSASLQQHQTHGHKSSTASGSALQTASSGGIQRVTGVGPVNFWVDGSFSTLSASSIEDQREWTR